MFFILQAIAIAIGVGFDHEFAIYAPLVIPAIYTIVMGAGTFSGGSDISVVKLNELLDPRWIHSEELAHYIKKYWVALEYSISASTRQSNCTVLAFLSIGVGVYYFFGLNNVLLASILGCLGIILYLMAMRVNRPLSIYKDPKFQSSIDERVLNEYRLAVTSLVAFSELFPDNQNYKYISDIVENDEYAKGIINNWRKRI